MAYLDFTQIYPTLSAVLLFLTGVYSTFVEQKNYAKQNLLREARWAKNIGIIWMTAGVSLFVSSWVWRNFIW